MKPLEGRGESSEHMVSHASQVPWLLSNQTGYCLTYWSVVNTGLSGWSSIKGDFIFITRVSLRTFHYRSFASPTKLPWMKHLLSVTFGLAMDSQLSAWGNCSNVCGMVCRPLFKHISCFLGNINSARVRSQPTAILNTNIGSESRPDLKQYARFCTIVLSLHPHCREAASCALWALSWVSAVSRYRAGLTGHCVDSTPELKFQAWPLLHSRLNKSKNNTLCLCVHSGPILTSICWSLPFSCHIHCLLRENAFFSQ